MGCLKGEGDFEGVRQHEEQTMVLQILSGHMQYIQRETKAIGHLE